MKPKTPKPRVMWATCETGEPERLHKTKADAAAWDYAGGYDARPDSVYRVAVIPLDDVEALVERAALALINSARGKDGMAKVGQFYKFPKDSQDFYLNDARAALTAAGIPCAKPTKQRRARK